MFERRSLRWPITLGVVMIVLIVAISIGWVVLAFITRQSNVSAALYWSLLSVGSLFLVLVLVGVVLYLTLSIKAINLNRRQSNFIDSVTHELKSPLASIKLYLQTLNRHQVGIEEQRTFFRSMLEDVERLDGLINHLLDAARLEQKPDTLETEDIEISTLLRECASEVCLQHRVPFDVIKFKLKPCVVRGRRVDVDMIFRNLLDNAVKYAAETPEIEVSAYPVLGSYVEVRIADNGRGIPPPARRKIFARFERLGSELERDKPGTGLGLYIVRTLVNRLRGRVRIRGREPSPGAVFEVRLPGRMADASEISTLSEPLNSPSPS